MNKKLSSKRKKDVITKKNDDGFETDSFNTDIENVIIEPESNLEEENEFDIQSSKKQKSSQVFNDDNISELDNVSEISEYEDEDEDEENKDGNDDENEEEDEKKQIDIWMESKNKTKKYDLKQFHWKKYLYYYEDLHHLDTKEEAWDHWMDHGKYEKRIFFTYDEKNGKIKDDSDLKITSKEKKNFDWKSYINFYPDLTKINTREKAWDHWIHHGKKEKRKYFRLDKEDNISRSEEYEKFPWKTYVNNYPDLKGLNTKEKAWNHWIQNGKKEKRVIYDLKEEEEHQYKQLKKMEQKKMEPKKEEEITKKTNSFFF